MRVLWEKTKQRRVRIFRNSGAQVGILRGVIRIGASEKVTVEQRLEEGERVRHADNRRMALCRSLPRASEQARGSGVNSRA